MNDTQLRQMILGMMAGDAADIEVIRTIQSQPRRCWKRYAQAFTGLDAQDIERVVEDEELEAALRDLGERIEREETEHLLSFPPIDDGLSWARAQ